MTNSNECRLVFLGSGGARIVVAKQIRASGGIWFNLDGTRFLVDPGPGALVRMTGSRHNLRPTELAGILLSHRHLDHAGDVNIMVEAMTLGGTERRGVLFAPEDALEGTDPVVLRYLRGFLEQVVTLAERGEYRLGNVVFSCPVRHRHRGEVYGFRFSIPGLTVSYVADTSYFPELAELYQADVVIVNVVRLERSELDHMHVPEAVELVRQMKPKLAVISHFGMTVVRARPWIVARQMSEETGCEVIAASDGRELDLRPYRAAGQTQRK
jgi:ribonuclease BN (tRNA processing enzyme)